jgi:hypothetical protein
LSMSPLIITFLGSSSLCSATCGGGAGKEDGQWLCRNCLCQRGGASGAEYWWSPAPIRHTTLCKVMSTRDQRDQGKDGQIEQWGLHWGP